MGWVGFAFVVLAAFALMAVPGALVLWLLRVRDVRVLLLAPAVGLGVLGLLTFAAAPFGGWLGVPIGANSSAGGRRRLAKGEGK